MAKRQPISQENGAEKRRRENGTEPRDETMEADLTTETVLETYDVKVSGGNCVHECVRPAELAGQALPPLPGTPAK